MEKFITIDHFEDFENKRSDRLAKFAQGNVENVLRSVTLSGYIALRAEEKKGVRTSGYKLVCADGQVYFFITDSYWESVLAWHKWENVIVKGLLNTNDMTLIPQKIFPNAPTADNENIIDFVAKKTRGVIKKLGKKINELVIIPAGLLVLMMVL